MLKYQILDYFFLFFHTVFTLFNLVGWIWKKTRRANLVTLLLTALAWFGLGIFYGIGYCPLTDWHWEVLGKLGRHDLPYSYITYIVQRLTGITPDSGLVEICTTAGFFTALIMSVYTNFSGREKRKCKR